MPLFESYDRRIKQINEALATFKGINVREIVNGIQPIAFENAGWAYVVGHDRYHGPHAFRRPVRGQLLFRPTWK